MFFYPRDFTFGCVREACAFRDYFEEFQKAGAEVIGISRDTAEEHRRFSGAYNLPYRLLSDPDKKVHRLYGVGHTLGILKERVTYIIGRDGLIRYRFNSPVFFRRHVLRALRHLNA